MSVPESSSKMQLAFAGCGAESVTVLTVCRNCLNAAVVSPNGGASSSARDTGVQQSAAWLPGNAASRGDDPPGRPANPPRSPGPGDRRCRCPALIGTGSRRGSLLRPSESDCDAA